MEKNELKITPNLAKSGNNDPIMARTVLAESKAGYLKYNILQIIYAIAICASKSGISSPPELKYFEIKSPKI